MSKDKPSTKDEYADILDTHDEAKLVAFLASRSIPGSTATIPSASSSSNTSNANIGLDTIVNRVLDRAEHDRSYASTVEQELERVRHGVTALSHAKITIVFN